MPLCLLLIRTSRNTIFFHFHGEFNVIKLVIEVFKEFIELIPWGNITLVSSINLFQLLGLMGYKSKVLCLNFSMKRLATIGARGDPIITPLIKKY